MLLFGHQRRVAEQFGYQDHDHNLAIEQFMQRYYRTVHALSRLNEMLLIQRGILNPNPDQKDESNFATDAYLAGQYEANVRRNLKDYRTGEERNVRFEDGILLPDYRLPTEAEWEYAALALQGNRSSEKDELITDRRIYPWNGNTVRYEKRDKYQGNMLANFKRSAGDYMGTAGKLNDDACPTAPCLLYTSPSPRDRTSSRMPSSA